MKSQETKIAYVLVCNESSYYLELIELSLSCLRRYNPGYRACVICDADTNLILEKKRHLLDLIDEVVVVTDDRLDDLSMVNRSRYIKTSLRNYISGSYLYVDIDAFPVGDLDELVDEDRSISMVYDQNVAPDDFVFEEYESYLFEKMDWTLPKQYFNSGVMLVKDDYLSRKFYDCWHELWRKTHLLGNHKDQPAMHQAIKITNISVGVLPKEANLLISLAPRSFWKNPIIYHISTIRLESRNDTLFHQIIRDLKTGKTLDYSALDSIVHSHYPWTDKNLLRNSYYTKKFHRLPYLILQKILQMLGANS